MQETWTGASLQVSPDEFSDLDDSSNDGSETILTPNTEGDQGEMDEFITESKDLHFSVNLSITSLLRISAQVHRSSRKAKFAKSSVDHEYSALPDISHVQDFFPFAAGNHALVGRLGKANAQRRQWLWYRRRHREKLSVDASDPRSSERLPVFGAEPRGDTDSIAIFSVDDQTTSSILSGTKATTFRSLPTVSVASESAIPETIYGRSSKASASEPRLKVPEPPTNLVLGQPFSCRYCCNIIEISGRNAWQ